MKKVQEIPFTGTSLVHGDGLALENHTLYVARNLENHEPFRIVFRGDYPLLLAWSLVHESYA